MYVTVKKNVLTKVLEINVLGHKIYKESEKLNFLP